MSRQSLPKTTPKKISTMPRKETPANIALENYKLTMEEARLQQELKNIETRRKQILQRLDQLTQQLDNIQAKILRQTATSNIEISPQASEQPVEKKSLKSQIKPEKLPHSFQFKTMDIDY